LPDFSESMFRDGSADRASFIEPCLPSPAAAFHVLRRRRNEPQAFLYAFDLLELNGSDLRREPIEVRKATLASIVRQASHGVRLNEHLAHPEGVIVFAHACKMGLEGIVSKRLGSRYRSGRSPEVQEPRPAPGEAGGGGGLAVINKRGPKPGTPREEIAGASPMSRASLAASC
jgi:hypothetical protein